MGAKIILVTGGARSGKSDFAERYAVGAGRTTALYCYCSGAR